MLADVDEFTVAPKRILRPPDQNQIARNSVTLVFDKGTAALDNTLQREEAKLGWISALLWNQKRAHNPLFLQAWIRPASPYPGSEQTARLNRSW